MTRNPYDWTDEMVADRNHWLRVVAFVGCLGVLAVLAVAIILLVVVGWFVHAFICVAVAAGVAGLALDLGLSLEEDR